MILTNPVVLTHKTKNAVDTRMMPLLTQTSHTATSTTTMAEPNWKEFLVPDEWLMVAVVSITVNVCTLLRGIVSRAVCHRRCGYSGWSEMKDCEVGLSRHWKNDQHYVLVAA